MADTALQEAIDDWREQAHSWKIVAGGFRRRAEAAEAKLEAIRQGTADLYIERDRLQARVEELEADNTALAMALEAISEAMRGASVAMKRLTALPFEEKDGE